MTKPPYSPRRAILAIALAIATLAATPAFAVNKDMVQLQTQVQELQDAVARLQQSNDERMGVLTNLVQQSADSINKMSITVNAMQQQMQAQQDASGGKLDNVSNQVQALGDSLDEIKARLNNLEKALQSVKDQQQSINATLQNLTPTPGGPLPGATTSPSATPGAAGGPIGTTQQPQQAFPGTASNGKPSADVPFAASQGAPILPSTMQAVPTAPVAPPAADLYKTALNDYMSARYTLSSSEFEKITHLYSDDPLSGNAYYYMGEIEYRAGKFSNAVKDYDHVINFFPDNSKVPVSHLHKGMALFQMKENEAGIREMRSLIARYPNSPEAVQARSRLNGMGVPVTPRRPA